MQFSLRTVESICNFNPSVLLQHVRDGNAAIVLIFINLGICICSLHAGSDGRITSFLYPSTRNRYLFLYKIFRSNNVQNLLNMKILYIKLYMLDNYSSSFFSFYLLSKSDE